VKVLELKTKKIIDVDDGYAERLIQHGMAILPPTVTKAEKEPRKKGDA